MKSGLMLYTYQVSVMVAVGIPVERALSFVAQGTDRRLNEIFQRCAQRVSGGAYLSQALREHPRIFSPVYVALVAAAERSGALVEVLAKLSQDLEKTSRSRARLLAALSYPAVLMVVCWGLLGLLMLYVVPAMAPLFSQLGVPLPWLTQAVLGLTNFLHNPAVLLAAVLGVTTVGVLVHQLLEADPESPLRRWLDARLLGLVGVGPLLRLELTGRLCWTLGLMLDSGLPLERSLLELSHGAGNLVVAEQVRAVHSDVLGGQELSSSASTHHLFPQVALALIRNAEETGHLGRSLRQAGALLDEELDDATTTLCSLAEPLVLGFTSMVIGVVSVATLLPWIRLLGDLF